MKEVYDYVDIFHSRFSFPLFYFHTIQYAVTTNKIKEK